MLPIMILNWSFDTHCSVRGFAEGLPLTVVVNVLLRREMHPSTTRSCSHRAVCPARQSILRVSSCASGVQTQVSP